MRPRGARCWRTVDSARMVSNPPASIQAPLPGSGRKNRISRPRQIPSARRRPSPRPLAVFPVGWRLTSITNAENGSFTAHHPPPGGWHGFHLSPNIPNLAERSRGVRLASATICGGSTRDAGEQGQHCPPAVCYAEAPRAPQRAGRHCPPFRRAGAPTMPGGPCPPYFYRPRSARRRRAALACSVTWAFGVPPARAWRILTACCVPISSRTRAARAMRRA